ncbi:AAA domain-containing protein [Armillaria luteobubalina]|uniref:AAA domain-containing protein n=1 Tax=Armillaria luteobubalina TaxID=153913 RepID=A0AA39Q210_9AGAR|nr:AAA domain-containing protein [Armillaria luteobubalina]
MEEAKATSGATMDALIRLLMEKEECCRCLRIIIGDTSGDGLHTTTDPLAEFTYGPDLNERQIEAIKSCEVPLSAIWGPPVVVQILPKILQSSQELPKILMTALTHNGAYVSSNIEDIRSRRTPKAVYKVLERFLKEINEGHYLCDEQILRIATDVSKVNKDLQSFTIGMRAGGNMNENDRLFKQAQRSGLMMQILNKTHSLGAGLGILHKSDFDIALIDEVSQIMEPCTLIPLVKGSQRAILVGDHVQLCPTVKKLGKALEFDVSLLERLYAGDD